MSSVAVDDDEQRQQRKRERKLQKRLARQAAAATVASDAEPPAEETQADQDAVNENNDDETVKTAAKKAAKKQKTSLSPATPLLSADAGVSAMSDADVSAFRQQHDITCSDETVKPINHFSQSGLSAALLKCTATFSAPTPIQAQCLPVILSGRDCIAIAETGSGKTLGFVLPGLRHILQQKPIVSMADARRANTLNNGAAGPIMLILSPTRELALQTQEVCTSASANVQLRSSCIYGGVHQSVQMSELKPGVHTIVATPGRLLSLVNEGTINLSRVTYLVLDEADRMLDKGFEPDIRAIISHITSTNRQTLMFSATWPVSIQALANEFMRDPVRITIGHINGDASELKANHRVSQKVTVLENDYEKESTLQSLLQKVHSSRSNRILIFVLYKKEVDRVEQTLRRRGWICVGISGDKSQHDRIAALHSFKTGTIPLLIATDVAARGLDIPSVEHVINYTFPLTVEDYIHRIGRTGRAGKTGESHTFFTKAEKHLSGELINVLKEAHQNIPDELLKFGTHVKKKEHAMYGAHFKPVEGPMKQSVRVKFD